MLKPSIAFATIVALSAPLTAIEEPGTAAPIVVGMRVTSTSFHARNFSGTPHVLIFESGGTLIWRTLNPGCDLGWSFPTQLLSGVRLEVASWHDGLWHRTGTIDLAAVAGRGTDALWVQGDATTTSWAELGAALFVEATGTSLFPATLPADSSAGSSGEAALLAPTHVPVITPSDTPQGDFPPEIEEKPLPPV